MTTKEQKDGPAKKFYLVKAHGKMLRAAGYDPKTMSCQELEAAIRQCAPYFGVELGDKQWRE